MSLSYLKRLELITRFNTMTRRGLLLDGKPVPPRMLGHWFQAFLRDIPAFEAMLEAFERGECSTHHQTHCPFCEGRVDERRLLGS